MHEKNAYLRKPTSHFGLPMRVAHSSNPQMETIDTN